jgi:hypothetical protein
MYTIDSGRERKKVSPEKRNYVIDDERKSFLLCLGRKENKDAQREKLVKIRSRAKNEKFYDTKIQYPNKHGHSIRFGNQ